MSNTPRMGRGLDALWSVGEKNSEDEKNYSTKSLDINLLLPNPNQPRRTFSDESLNELATSIREQGIIQPILVRPAKESKKFEIIAGERRYRAALIVELTEVPVYVVEMSDEDVMAAALIENIQREDLNPVEEALAIRRLRDECNITQEQLAKKLGKSRSAIANTLRLLQLPDNIKDALTKGILQAGHARTLLSFDKDSSEQQKLFLNIQENDLSVREAEAAVNYYKEHTIFPFENVVENIEESIEESIEQEPNSNNDTIEEEDNSQEKKSSRRNKSEYIKNLQSKMKNHLNIKTSISGSEDRGRIVITYSNADELMALLLRMGIEEGDGGNTSGDMFPVKQ